MSCPAAADDVDDDGSAGALASRSAIFSVPVGGLQSPEIICARVEVMPAVLLPTEVVVVDGVAVTEMTGF